MCTHPTRGRLLCGRANAYINVQVLLAQAARALAVCWSFSIVHTEELTRALGLLRGEHHWRGEKG